MKKFFALILLTYSLSSLSQTILKGKDLEKGKRYYSAKGYFYSIFQNDGNFVIYNHKNADIWSTKTQKKGSKASFKSDGNFVIYDSAGNSVWNSESANKNGSELTLKDDGNLCIFDKTGTIWCSGSIVRAEDIPYNIDGLNGSNQTNGGGYGGNQTNGGIVVPKNATIYPGQTINKDEKLYSSNGAYYLLFQNNGNLVLYKSNNNPIWNSNTQDKGNKAIFQTDGNLVIYNAGKTAVFSSQTAKKKAVRLVLQDDGNLVIYNASGAAVWSSGTNGR